MRRLMVAVLAAALLVWPSAAESAVPPAQPPASTSPAALGATTSVVAKAATRRLRIPAIRVNAGIIPVGTRGGQLDIGHSVRDVYRWGRGVIPGKLGSAVLAGHTWSKGPGVFDRLGQLRRGNMVTVGTTRFKVTRVRRVRRLSADEVRRLFSDRGKPRLVLITCGDRNDVTGIYRTRIIVNAKKIKRVRRVVAG